MDNVKIYEPLYKSNHNQIHFDIKVKSESTNKKYRTNFHKDKYKNMKTYIAKLDWNNILRKNAIECWTILRCVIQRIIDQFVPLKKKQEKRSRKKHLSKEAIGNIAYNKLCGGFIGEPERMKTTQITKRHLM